mgnify:CR=1 FL=1
MFVSLKADSEKGDIIDLSANKVETKKKERVYYLKRENYSINTNEVIFAGAVRVNDFKAGIEKQGSTLSVNSRASFMGHELNYSREKNDNIDVNIIDSSDITYFVNDNHAAKKLLSDGEFKMTSIRNLKITDSPKFSYRGMLLDISRNFYGPKKIKQILRINHYKKGTYNAN